VAVPACAWRAHAASWTDVVAMWASGRADGGDVCAGRESRVSDPACEGGRSGGAAPCDSTSGDCATGVCAAPADSRAACGRTCCSCTGAPDADQASRWPGGAPTGAGPGAGTLREPDAGAPEPRTSGAVAAPASGAMAGGMPACGAQAGSAFAWQWPAAQARALQRAALAALTGLAACAPEVRAPAQQPSRGRTLCSAAGLRACRIHAACEHPSSQTGLWQGRSCRQACQPAARPPAALTVCEPCSQ